jgi:uncharacterized membrane protein YqjE
VSGTAPGEVDPMLGTPPAEAVQPGAPDQRSLGEIVSDVASDLSDLLRQEVELAKTELKQEAAKAGKGAGLLGGASIAAHLVLVFVSLAALFLLDNWMPTELAALVVAVVWAVAAAALAMAGRKSLQRTNPQLPKTQQTLKEDAAWARAQRS